MQWKPENSKDSEFHVLHPVFCLAGSIVGCQIPPPPPHNHVLVLDIFHCLKLGMLACKSLNYSLITYVVFLFLPCHQINSKQWTICDYIFRPRLCIPCLLFKLDKEGLQFEMPISHYMIVSSDHLLPPLSPLFFFWHQQKGSQSSSR